MNPTEVKSYELYIDYQEYSNKPSNVKRISKRIVNHKVSRTPQQIAAEIAKGKTILPAIMNGGRSNSNFVEQSVYAIDFDNDMYLIGEDGKKVKDNNGKYIKIKSEGEEYNSLEEILNDDFIKSHASFVYKTFSYTEQWERFRAVFFLSRPLINIEEATKLHTALANRFTNIDASAKDVARLFYGGNEVIEVNYNNVLSVDEMLAEAEEIEDEGEPLPFTLTPQVGKDDFDSFDDEVEKYIELDEENLLDESNWTSILYSLLNSIYTGELTQEQAEKYCAWIALGDKEWAYRNVERLRYELKLKTTPESNWTFISKVRAVTKPRPKSKKRSKRYQYDSMSAVKKRLKELGDEWRANNVNDKGIAPVMPHYTIANFLTNNIAFLLIGETKDLSKLFFYDYDEGIYRSSETELNELITLVEYRSKPNHWNDVMGYLRVNTKHSKLFSNPDLIPCNNGLYEESTGKLLPFSFKYPIITKLETDYNPNAKLVDYTLSNGKTWNVETWLKELVEGDEEQVTLMYQIFNETFNSNRNRKALGFFIGKSNSGKGTLARLLTNIIGADKVSSLKVEDFKDKFRVANLEGKVANIGDDISTSYIDNVQDLMSLASGDPITIEQKFGRAYRAEFKTFCLFSGEAMPRVQNKQDGWYNRLKVIFFPKGYTTAEAMPEIKDELIDKKDVKEYILKKTLETKFDRFIEPKATKALLGEYRKENDYIYAFITDEYIPGGYHELEKVPNNYIKSRIQQTIYEYNSQQSVKYHYIGDVVKYLEKETGYKYKVDKVRYPTSEANLLVNEYGISDSYLNHKNPIRSLIKIE